MEVGLRCYFADSMIAFAPHSLSFTFLDNKIAAAMITMLLSRRFCIEVFNH